MSTVFLKKMTFTHFEVGGILILEGYKLERTRSNLIGVSI